MKSPTMKSSANTPRPTLGFRPFTPSTPAQRGDTGRGPLPRCADGKESRHVNLTDTGRGGKSGGF